jgi:2-(1,2-epoxy-1,2-dihydrophenyl)acetyl-CoA isomerase
MTIVTLERDGDVAVISLNRPEAANAIDHALAAELKRTAEQIAAEGWARAVLLRAEGKMFCGGGDVGAMIAERAKSDDAAYVEFFRSLVQGFHEATVALTSIDAPLIAAVHGTAAGGGMSLVLACDIILAAPRAKFVPAYPGIGLSTDGGMSWSLSRAVGQRRAMQILIENRPIDANEALSLGMISEIVSDDDFDFVARAKAQTLAKLPRKAISGIRALIQEGGQRTMAQQLDAERDTIVSLAGSKDAAEGLSAFAEKRLPQFTD